MQPGSRQADFSEELEREVEGLLSQAEDCLSEVEWRIDELRSRVGAEWRALSARVSNLVFTLDKKPKGNICLN